MQPITETKKQKAFWKNRVAPCTQGDKIESLDPLKETSEALPHKGTELLID